MFYRSCAFSCHFTDVNTSVQKDNSFFKLCRISYFYHIKATTLYFSVLLASQSRFSDLKTFFHPPHPQMLKTTQTETEQEAEFWAMLITDNHPRLFEFIGINLMHAKLKICLPRKHTTLILFISQKFLQLPLRE